MENKQLKEQIAFDYRGQPSSPVSRPGRSRGLPGERGTRVSRRARREEVSKTRNGPETRKRVVTTPKDVVQPIPWADRRARLRGVQAGPHPKSRMVRRTLAQTGIPAPEGQVRLIRPLPRQPYPSKVPVRSGRRNARSRSGWRRFLSLFALLAIAILGGSFALASPNFRVQQVDVVGTQNRALLHTIQHMGIQGQNIFLLDVGGLSARIEAFPLVASANLGKQLPNQLTVAIVERTPVILWQTRQGTFSVDSQGVVIAPASETAHVDHLMTVVDTRGGTAAQQVRPGARLNAADIAFATQVFSRLPQLMGVSTFTLRYVDAASVGVQSNVPRQAGNSSFVVVSSDGWSAYLGGADDSNPLDNRLIELQQILGLAQRQQWNLATIDLRFGLRPVYTLKA